MHICSSLHAEHVLDLETYLSEAARVLKSDGHLLISWKPSWQSPRGHHIHPDMVSVCTLPSAIYDVCATCEQMHHNARAEGSCFAD